MKLNVTTIGRLALAAVIAMTCAAACSGTNDDESNVDGDDVAPRGDEAAPAEDTNQSTVELGQAEQAVCRCEGYEGSIRCSTTGQHFYYMMCSGVSYNNARNACLGACSGSCVTQPSQC